MAAQKTSQIFLLRHGHSTANGKGILAGRTAGTSLSKVGIAQAQTLVSVFENSKIAKIYSSPLVRCIQTLEPLRANFNQTPFEELKGVIEMEYGDWTGEKLIKLARKPLWREIQSKPSRVTFPNGESFKAMQKRAIRSVSDAIVPGKSIVICSHGDVIKALVAHYIGLALDDFQRLVIDPASISLIEVGPKNSNLIYSNQTSHLSKIAAPAASSKKLASLRLGGGSGSVTK